VTLKHLISLLDLHRSLQALMHEMLRCALQLYEQFRQDLSLHFEVFQDQEVNAMKLKSADSLVRALSGVGSNIK